MTYPQTIAPDQANKETPIQEDLLAVAQAAIYGPRPEAHSGLTWGYHGTGGAVRWGGFSVADGTLSLSASSTNYVVVLRSSGAISVSTSSTNWDNTAAYARTHILVTDGSGVTDSQDHRAGPGGTHGSASAAGSGTELRGLTFTSDTGSTADSDPGAGLFKWNNATQGSATFLYIDETTADAVNLDAAFADMGASGKLFIQQSDDAAAWQLWSWTAAPTDGTGYWKLAVTLLAKGTDIDDAALCYFDFDDEGSAASGGTAGKHAIYIAAAAMIPSATGGCAALATIASAANQPDISTLDFDATTVEYAQFGIVMPKSWNEGTITFKAHWSHAATTTNFGVAFSLQAVAVSDDDAIATAYGTAQTVTDAGGTTNDLYASAESSAITVGGSPAAEDMVFFRVARETGNGSDTMAIDARLHGITVFITTDAETDA